MDNPYNHIWLVVETYPSEKYISSSVGMMTFPTEWKVIQNSMVPVTTNPRVDSSHVSHDEIRTWW
jgi:hypothetical protein